MIKQIIKQFILSLWRDGWIDFRMEKNNYKEFDEWFERQYKSRLSSYEKSLIEKDE